VEGFTPGRIIQVTLSQLGGAGGLAVVVAMKGLDVGFGFGLVGFGRVGLGPTGFFVGLGLGFLVGLGFLSEQVVQ